MHSYFASFKGPRDCLGQLCYYASNLLHVYKILHAHANMIWLQKEFLCSLLQDLTRPRRVEFWRASTFAIILHIFHVRVMDCGVLCVVRSCAHNDSLGVTTIDRNTIHRSTIKTNTINRNTVAKETQSLHSSSTQCQQPFR